MPKSAPPTAPPSGPQPTPAPAPDPADHDRTLSLRTAAARNLATTTKSAPQMQEITSRWLLRMLPWTQVSGGTYRVNRRLTYQVGDGRVAFVKTGSEIRIIPETLIELPLLHGFTDLEVLTALAETLVQHEYAAGEVIVQNGAPVDAAYLIAHGKVNKIGVGEYGDMAVLGVLADGDHFGEQYVLPSSEGRRWDFSITAATAVTVLAMPLTAMTNLGARADRLLAHLERVLTGPKPPQNKYGEAAISLAAGHVGEAQLPGTFVDYDLTPREYELSVAQTVLRVHTRVADLFNQPMNQTEQQIRLTVEALRERQESELINNPEFGLLHNAELKQCIHTRSGPPTPDDLDELLSRRRRTSFLLAHPNAIAAFGRECTHRGVYPETIDVAGHKVPSWRGIPLLPCNKIPISQGSTTSILALRTGEEDQGVVGLHQIGLPDEIEPGLSVRFMGISDQAILSYLVTAYFSVAVLVPDALGILENVELGHYHD